MLAGVAVLMTAGVYGLVAGIVKIDDAAFYLSQRANAAARMIGRALLWLTPWLMKALSALGTLAMFLVGGGILAHGVPPLGHAITGWAGQAGAVAGAIGSILANLGIGFVAGVIVLAVVRAVKRGA